MPKHAFTADPKSFANVDGVINDADIGKLFRKRANGNVEAHVFISAGDTRFHVVLSADTRQTFSGRQNSIRSLVVGVVGRGVVVHNLAGATEDQIDLLARFDEGHPIVFRGAVGEPRGTVACRLINLLRDNLYIDLDTLLPAPEAVETSPDVTDKPMAFDDVRLLDEIETIAVAEQIASKLKWSPDAHCVVRDETRNRHGNLVGYNLHVQIKPLTFNTCLVVGRFISGVASIVAKSEPDESEAATLIRLLDRCRHVVAMGDYRELPDLPDFYQLILGAGAVSELSGAAA